jgi:ParB family transcriptional regulator, chromosome partitioning protein
VSKERRLGRGLEALLGRNARTGPGAESDSNEADEKTAEVTDGKTRQVIRRTDGPHTLAGQIVSAEREQLGTQVSTSGVEELLPEEKNPIEPDQDSAADETKSLAIEPDVVMVDVQLIDRNPFQPRTDFGDESLDQLADSIDDHGILQPLVVRRVDESYQLIAGERRLRAAQKAGHSEVPVRVIVADDQRASELAIVENLQRKDLGPLEKAASFRKYLQLHGCTQNELAGRLKIDRSTIANLIRLLDLPEQVQVDLSNGKLTGGHARALLPLDNVEAQIELAQRVASEGLTVRDVERLVKETNPKSKPGSTKKSSSGQPSNDHLEHLEQELRTALGTKVSLKHNAKGKGKMVIHFNNHDEFNRIKKQITG